MEEEFHIYSFKTLSLYPQEKGVKAAGRREHEDGGKRKREREREEEFPQERERGGMWEKYVWVRGGGAGLGRERVLAVVEEEKHE